MAPPLFNRALVARHLARRPAGYDDFVTRLVLDDLAERLSAVSRPVAHAAILSPDAAAMPARGATAAGGFAFTRLSTLPGGDVDPAAPALPRTDYSLVVSLLDLQIVDDPAAYLAGIRAHLAPDGLFLGAALGGATLRELRLALLEAESATRGGAHARVAPFIALADAGPLLQRAGFALPVADIESHVVRYPDALALMRELKALGAANPLWERPSGMIGQAILAAAVAAYRAAASARDGRVRATLEIVWLSGWAPHESQQKPLAPGSAEVSLAATLGRRVGG